jgi:tRNA threonylcarbamoyladenosine biosynthesis protein TsaB
VIILLDTSTPVCRLTLIDGQQQFDSEWQADRDLARGLLIYLNDQMAAHDWTWGDISGIGVYQGPGSFTGLRIGLTVMNTIAAAQQIAVVGANGYQWSQTAVERLRSGENDRIVLPIYGSEAHITSPRK